MKFKFEKRMGKKSDISLLVTSLSKKKKKKDLNWSVMVIINLDFLFFFNSKNNAYNFL